MIAVDNATIPGSAISSLLASKVMMPSASNGGADLGTVYTRTFSNLFSSSSWNITRIGNIVHLSGIGNFNPGVSTFGAFPMPIVYGYRPAIDTFANGIGFNGGLSTWQSLRIPAGGANGTDVPNGTFYGSNTGNQENHMTATWITADPITPVLGDSKIALS